MMSRSARPVNRLGVFYHRMLHCRRANRDRKAILNVPVGPAGRGSQLCGYNALLEGFEVALRPRPRHDL